jgi:hypothetical protein
MLENNPFMWYKYSISSSTTKETLMSTYLDSARISADQATECMHLLAAANHRHWIQWEGHILPLMEDSDKAGLDALLHGNLPTELTAKLVRHAQSVADLIEQVVFTFAWPVPPEPLVQRKREQLQSWLNYASSRPAEDYERWKLQCRLPFLSLSPSAQNSDYAEALRDLQVIASASGLVLPEPFPDVKPLIGKPADKRLRRHKRGWHGHYTISEVPWSRTCQACHAEIGSYR